MSEYPPEVQRLIDAAIAAAPNMTGPASLICELDAAIAAYRKSIAPPEPFETRWVWDPRAGGFAPGNIPEDDAIDSPAGPVWRCTVTPVERVR